MSKYNYTEENLKAILASSFSLSEIARKITGTDKAHGSVIAKVKYKLDLYGVDYTHLDGRRWSKGKINPIKNAHTRETFIAEYLSKNPLKRTSSSGLKNFLFKFDIKQNECEECGLGAYWNGKPINNQLDHIDGNNSNNELSNLRIVCPNCHSQTDTFTGRNIKNNGRLAESGLLR